MASLTAVHDVTVDRDGKRRDEMCYSKHTGHVRPGPRNTRRRVGSWNVGGQPLPKVDAVCGSLDVVVLQEVPRGEEGWGESTTDGFSWLTYRHPTQWRGVGVGISHDIFDCCTDKTAFDRGAAWLLRFKNNRRLIFASLHLPTGVPTHVYHAATQAFRQRLLRWKPGVPCFVGVDVNEVVDWTCGNTEDSPATVEVRAGAKIDKFLEAAADNQLRLIAPVFTDRWLPTHFPRDASREGRHIDAVLVRQITCSPVRVNADVRFHINTDHARLECEIDIPATSWGCWVDSRARWVAPGASLSPPVSWDALVDMAGRCTKPRKKNKFEDTDEIREATRRAKAARGREGIILWHAVHRLRRRARREWQRQRAGQVLAGNWQAYRDIRSATKRRCWWGALLNDKSAREVASDVEAHLGDKVFDPVLDWHAELVSRLEAIPCPAGKHVPIQRAEVGIALSKMKARSAVGPDGVGVDLLRSVFEGFPDELCGLLDMTFAEGALPVNWGESLLALLPKTSAPSGAKELRPIAMSCCGMKLLSKIIMQRSFRRLRQDSPWSACGQNRSTADMHGVLGRLRDMTREWRLGVVLVKLDIEGAFDFVNRKAVADFIDTRLDNGEMAFEKRFLLKLLDENTLRGSAPGGASVRVRCNRGIRQGSPESAEIFGMLVSDVVNRIKASGRWRNPTGRLQDIPADVGTYQDDIFLWSDNAGVLEKNIDLIAGELRLLGLRLAVKKTCIIASKYYKGRRVVRVDGIDVPILDCGSSVRVLGLDYDLDAPAVQQARELHGRVWSAFHEHKTFLCGPGSWDEKQRLVQMLVEGTWSWSAGAVHWETAELQMMNSTQLRVLRLAFGIRRGANEDWVSYNTRSLRLVRTWIAQTGAERWSTKILRLQFQLAGHWMRQREGGDDVRGIAGRMTLWRASGWWNHEKSLTTGARHPMRFRASNLERSLAHCLGENWFHACSSRDAWRQLRAKWLADMDVPWTRGRQLSLCM